MYLYHAIQVYLLYYTDYSTYSVEVSKNCPVYLFVYNKNDAYNICLYA